MENWKKILSGLIMLALLIGIIVPIALNVSNDNTAPSGTGIVINEVMSKNSGSVPDINGNYYDWIELYNTTSSFVDISGLGLSDDFKKGVKYVFPQGTSVEPGGFLIVYCYGGEAQGFYAPFRLSASDSVLLYDVRGASIDSVSLIATESGKTLSRDAVTGKWFESDPSPGYPNTPEGIEQYRAASQTGTADIGIYINEFMASNRTTITDYHGAYSDWVELYNSTDSEINLSGFYISDDINSPGKYMLPEGLKIEPKGYLLIFCSGNEGFLGDNNEPHIPFRLKTYGESVLLSDNQGRILDSYTYESQRPDISMARVVDGTGAFEPCAHPTPGYPNTSEGYEAYSAEHAIPLSNLFISEILGKNSSSLSVANPDTGIAEYPDWIELSNTGSEAVNLAGYALSDSANNPAKWVFPDITLGAGECLIVIADGRDTSEKISGYLHTSFNINRDGEVLLLIDPSGKIIDKLPASKFIDNMSIGRQSDGALRYFSEPTPGEPNSATAEKTYKGVLTSPAFETTPGIYSEESLTVQITAESNTTIYYTTDCSNPTTNSLVYNTETGITVGSNTVIRAIAYKDDYYCGQASVSGTFLFEHDDVNHSLPIATVVTDPANLWDSATGIYLKEGNLWDPENDEWPYSTANYYQSDWERPGAFSIFDDTGKEVFSQNIGVAVSGAFGRGRDQKALLVVARDEYGSDRMNYAFFEDLEFTEYKALVLRCGSQDQTLSKIRDELSVEVLKGYDMPFLYQDYKPYILYLNGEYWGVYFLREKRNRFFVAQHEGLENADTLDLMKSDTRYQHGSPQSWVELMNYIKTHSLTDSAAFAHIDENIDLDSFMDYMICEIYVANTDTWNVQYYRVPGGKWKWIYYDFCWGWHNVDTNAVKMRRQSDKPMSDLFNALLAVPEWRDKFLRRTAEIMNTVFEPSRVLEKINMLYNAVEPEIKREREKFNSPGRVGANSNDPVNYASYDGFQNYIAKLKNFAEKRPQIMKQHLKAEFGLSDAYMAEVFG